MDVRPAHLVRLCGVVVARGLWLCSLYTVALLTTSTYGHRHMHDGAHLSCAPGRTVAGRTYTHYGYTHYGYTHDGAWSNWISMNFPNREELSFRTVFAFPNASNNGLDSKTFCSTGRD